MNTTFAIHTKNLSFFFIATFIFVGVNTLSARAEKLRCFVDICIDSSSVELSKSDIPGAASYPVRTILASQTGIPTLYRSDIVWDERRVNRGFHIFMPSQA